MQGIAASTRSSIGRVSYHIILNLHGERVRRPNLVHAAHMNAALVRPSQVRCAHARSVRLYAYVHAYYACLYTGPSPPPPQKKQTSLYRDFRRAEANLRQVLALSDQFHQDMDEPLANESPAIPLGLNYSLPRIQGRELFFLKESSRGLDR